jgi:hypothetical protein
MLNSKKSKSSLLQIMFVLFSCYSIGQTYVVGTGASSGRGVPIDISNSTFNGNRLACHRSITIYRDGTQILNMPGGFPNSGNQTISSIGWKAANDCVYSGTLKIYIKQTSATSAGVEDWNTVTIAGATLVYNATVTLTNTTGAYTGISLQTPFVWDNASNLQIAVEFNSSSYPGCAPSWFRSSDNSGNSVTRYDTQVSCASQLGNASTNSYANTQFNGIQPLPTIASSGALTDACFTANSQTTTMAYSATTNSPNSYSINWDAAANTAGLADQTATPFSFLPAGGTLTGIVVSANVPAGSYSGIMTLSNSGGFSTTLAITINILPAPSVSFTGGASSICVGGTSTYTTTSSNATIVSYSILSGGASINQTTGVANNITSNFTVRATAFGSCGSTTTDFPVVVTTGVGTPNFTAGAATLCVGGASTYTASAAGASTISYSILNGGASIVSTTGVVSNVTGNFTVRATATGSCGGPTTSDRAVTVSSSAGTPSFTAGASTLCAGGSSTYTATALGASSITYSIVNGGATINSANGLVSNVTANFTVQATASGSCGSPATANFPVTVTANVGTPAFTSGAATVCVNGTGTYTATASNSTGIAYSILTGGASINSTTGVISNVTSNFTVRATATGVCSGPTTADLSVSVPASVGTPSFTAGEVTLCVGATSTYTASATGSSSVTYSILSGGAAIVSATGVVSNVTSNFTVRATATGTCGGPTTSDRAVTVTTGAGTPSFTAGASTLCVGGSSTYTSTALGASTITYSIVNGGATINSATGLVSNVTANFTVRATASATCGSPTTANFPVTVTANVGTPAFTSGAATVCVNGTGTYTATATNSTGIAYSILTGGASINPTTGVISNVTANFTVRATATGVCGNPATADLPVTVPANVATPAFTAGASTLCVGGSSTYTATATNSTGITYSVVNGGATINANSGVISNVTANFTVRATASGACGNPTTANFAVTVTPNLSAPVFTTGASTLCVGGNSTYAATAANSTGIAYSILNGGASINSSTGVVSNVTANFTVRAAATGSCGGPLNVDLAVVVNPATSITTQPATQSVCDGGTVTFSTVANGQNLAYLWNKNGNPINTATGSTYTINPVSSANVGSYTVTVTGACGTVTSQAANLTVNALLSITQQPQTQTVCENDTLTLRVATSVTGQYQWQFNGGDISAANSPDYAINGATVSQAGTYTVNITSNCGNATSNPAQLTVKPNITNIKSGTFCNGSVFEFAGQFITEPGTYIGRFPASNGCDSVVTLNLSLISPNASIDVVNGVELSTGNFSTYQWLFNGSPIQGANSQTYSANQNGEYRVLISDANGCKDTSDLVLISSLGIAAYVPDGTWELFPNPVSTNLFIQGSVGISGKFSCQLYDIAGRMLVQSSGLTSNGTIHTTLNMEPFESGIYVLTICNKEGVTLKNFKVLKN